MIVNNLSWKVAGAAGDGILNAGLSLFGKTCQRGGLHVMATAEYPSLIRGGHNHLDVRVSDHPLTSHTKHVTLLLALDQNSIDKHKFKIVPSGGIVYDADEIKDPKVERRDISLYPVPLKTLAEQAGGLIMRNTVGIGASLGLLNCGLDILNGVIKDNFGKKGDKVVDANVNAARMGYEYMRAHFSDPFPFQLQFGTANGDVFLSGHDALSTGAIKAGCKFYSAYPMTPASSLLHVFAKHERTYGIVVKHTEDEIAAINMAIGAGYAGVRAMTGTSGGGFALMVEGFGLAAMTETPLVVVESMRPGPATGMATHSGQADLRFVLHASTDEFPRIVMAPGDVTECFDLATRAFNLAEKYQMPVVIMTDKYLGESYWTVPSFTQDVSIERGEVVTNAEGEYNRYKNTPSGVSPRTVPGVKGGHYVATSYEHDEHGFEREEEEIRVMMHQKRFRKMENIKKEIPQPTLVGPADADVTIISWGSPKGPILEAMQLLRRQGVTANFLQIVFLSPFPSETVKSVLQKAKRSIVVENNFTSQLSSVIREHCLVDVHHKILKYDGRPFHPEDLAEEIARLAKPAHGFAAKVGGA